MPSLVNANTQGQTLYAMWSPVSLGEPQASPDVTFRTPSQIVQMNDVVQVPPPLSSYDTPLFFGYPTPQSNEDTLRVFLYLFRGDPGVGMEPPSLFWQGRVRYQVALSADPATGQVLFTDPALNEGHLLQVKQLLTGDPNVADVTLALLHEHAQQRDPHGILAEPTAPRKVTKSELSPCEIAIGEVVIDAFALLCGFPGIAQKLDEVAIQQVANAARNFPIVDFFRSLQAADMENRFKLVVGVAEAVGKGEMANIVRVMINGLSTMDKILYGAILVAEGALAFVTDGMTIVAILGVESVIGGAFLGEDIIRAFNTCNIPLPVDAPRSGTGIGIGSGTTPPVSPLFDGTTPVYLRLENLSRFRTTTSDRGPVSQTPPGTNTMEDRWLVSTDSEIAGGYRIVNQATQQFLVLGSDSAGRHGGQLVVSRYGQQGTDAVWRITPWGGAGTNDSSYIITDISGVWGIAGDNAPLLVQKELVHSPEFRVWIEKVPE